MKRRDCVLIAKVLKKVSSEIQKGIPRDDIAAIEMIISHFCFALNEENSSFNEQKFRDYIKKGE